MTGKPYRAVSRKDRIEQALAFNPGEPFNRIAERVGCTPAQVWKVAVELEAVDRHVDQADHEWPAPETPREAHAEAQRHRAAGQPLCDQCRPGEQEYQAARQTAKPRRVPVDVEVRRAKDRERKRLARVAARAGRRGAA